MKLGKLTATVLVVHDLEKCMAFYQDILGLKVLFTDDVSAAYKIEDHDLVVLKEAAAAEMVGAEALEVGKGSRVILCLGVENVDATYEALTAKGAKGIRPPKSQAWGRRTAYFADPDGNLWELWHELPAEK